MDIIGEKGEYESEYLRELLRCDLPAYQLTAWIRTLKRGEVLDSLSNRGIRWACRGAYILLGLEHDELFERLSEKISATNRNLSSSDRSKMLAIFEKLNADTNNLKTIREKMEEKAKGKEGSAWENNPPPPIYSGCGSVNDLYRGLLRNAGLGWAVFPHHPNIISAFGFGDEEEFKKKLQQLNPNLSEHLLKFFEFHKTSGELGWTDDALTSGSEFNEGDYVFSRFQVPLPYNDWVSGKGTVGLFLDMDHSVLGRGRIAITSAHNVFAHLSVSSEDEVRRFNEKVDFSHYDVDQPVEPFKTSLDFCVLEVARNACVVNAGGDQRLGIKLVDLSKFCIPEGSSIIKYGKSTGHTVGNLLARNKDVNGRASLAVSSPMKGAFATGGDSGAPYLYLADNCLIPVALHRCSDNFETNGVFLSGGSDIVECLRKYVQKRKTADNPPSAEEIIESFTLSPSGRYGDIFYYGYGSVNKFYDDLLQNAGLGWALFRHHPNIISAFGFGEEEDFRKKLLQLNPHLCAHLFKFFEFHKTSGEFGWTDD